MTTSPHDSSAEARKAGLNNFACRFSRWLGDGVAAVLVRFPIHPNFVTLFAFAVALVGASFGTRGNYFGFVICAVLIFVSGILDYADGSLARRKKLSSRFGAYLDDTCDELKNIALLLCLAVGLYNTNLPTWIVLMPIFTYFGDELITYTMTRYRVEFIDPRAGKQSVEEIFLGSTLLQIGRNLLPPVFLRQLIFPIFAFVGRAPEFIVGYAVYTVALALGFTFKVVLDISIKHKSGKKRHSGS